MAGILCYNNHVPHNVSNELNFNNEVKMIRYLKNLSFILTILIVSILTGCGGGSSSSTDSNDKEVSSVIMDPNNGGVNNGESNVSLTPNIALTFSTPMDPSTVNTSTVLLSASPILQNKVAVETDTLVPITSLSSNNSHTIFTTSPISPLLTNTTYYVTITNGVKNIYGTEIANTQFSFRTGENVAPTVNMIDPKNGSLINSINPEITVKFSESVLNVNSDNVKLYADANKTINVGIQYIEERQDNTYVIKPTTLNYITTYSLVLDSAITDKSTNANNLQTTIFYFTVGSNPNLFSNDPVPPTPLAPLGTYNGTPYTQLSNPTGLTNYPNDFFPNNLQSMSLQIAYGNNTESEVRNLTSLILIGSNGLCSATPVSYDQQNDVTYLIGAAHCFIESKNVSTTIQYGNFFAKEDLFALYGDGFSSASLPVAYVVDAIFVPQDYCYMATFSNTGGCPNFVPGDTNGGYGNDIAVIKVQGEFGNSSLSYPHVVESSLYPQSYAMAPIMAVGYGISRQDPSYNADCSNSGCADMFYVANYLYWQQDAPGYHYLYSSFYNVNNTPPFSTGYAALVCGGDSGGGDLFWDGSRWILLAEHTYGIGNNCGGFYQFLPNGSTNVSAYYNWIKSIIDNPDNIALCKNGTIGNCATNG